VALAKSGWSFPEPFGTLIVDQVVAICDTSRAEIPPHTIILPRIKICGKEIFPLVFRHPIMLGLTND
jgi:hypothetical protein